LEHVRFGSKADVTRSNRDICCHPQYKAARHNELALFVNRRDGAACGQGNNVIVSREEEWVSAHEKRCRPRLGHCRKGRVDFSLAAGMQNLNLLSGFARGRLYFLELGSIRHT
jgi:hypothetical protein